MFNRVLTKGFLLFFNDVLEVSVLLTGYKRN